MGSMLHGAMCPTKVGKGRHVWVAELGRAPAGEEWGAIRHQLRIGRESSGPCLPLAGLEVRSLLERPPWRSLGRAKTVCLSVLRRVRIESGVHGSASSTEKLCLWVLAVEPEACCRRRQCALWLFRESPSVRGQVFCVCSGIVKACKDHHVCGK